MAAEEERPPRPAPSENPDDVGPSGSHLGDLDRAAGGRQLGGDGVGDLPFPAPPGTSDGFTESIPTSIWSSSIVGSNFGSNIRVLHPGAPPQRTGALYRSLEPRTRFVVLNSCPLNLTAMIVEKRHLDGFTLLNLEGVIKLGESAQFFAQTLERALKDDSGHVIIDFSRINYIDSTGIGELVGYLGRFRDFKRELILVNPSERIRKLLQVARLAELFPTYDTVPAAMAGER